MLHQSMYDFFGCKRLMKQQRANYLYEDTSYNKIQKFDDSETKNVNESSHFPPYSIAEVYVMERTNANMCEGN